jgi:glutaminyl-peptide cyclotransferase
MSNLFARIEPSPDPADAVAPAKDSRPALMLCAHWDTRPVADHDPDPARRHLPVPGASDGASGVAVLLEIARALHVRRPPVPVLIGLFDAEDLGEYYYGSRIFARDVRRPAFARWRPRQAVLLDMIGGRGLRCATELHSLRLAPALWARLHASADAAGVGHRFRGAERTVSDDHLFLNRAGIPAVVLIDCGYPHWHTTADDVDACGAESLGAVGAAVLHLVRSMEPS